MKYLLVLALFAPTLAMAAQEGNGGDVLVCDEADGKKSYKFFDVHEGKKLDFEFNLGPKDWTVRQKVEEFLKRLHVLSPLREKEYGERAMKLLANIEEWSNNPVEVRLKDVHFTMDRLIDIPDTGRTTYPENCEVKQLVIQAEPKLSTDRLYQINIPLFKELDNDSVAMMITHEAILPEAFANSQKDTRMARYMNIVIASGQLATMTEKAWYEHLKMIEFERFDKDNVVIKTNSVTPTFDDQGRLRSVASGAWLYKDSEDKVRAEILKGVRFDENGKKLAFVLRGFEMQNYDLWGWKDERNTFFMLRDSVGFHANGEFRFMKPRKSGGYTESQFILKFQGREVKLNVRHGLTIFRAADKSVVGYSNAFEEGGGTVMAANLPPEEYLSETLADKFADDASLARPYIYRLTNPTYRGKPILITENGYLGYELKTTTLCEVLGFAETLNVSAKTIDGGEAYRYVQALQDQPAKWELVDTKNRNPVSGFFVGKTDPLIIKEVICAK